MRLQADAVDWDAVALERSERSWSARIFGPAVSTQSLM
jgi:hypothetical protein